MSKTGELATATAAKHLVSHLRLMGSSSVWKDFKTLLDRTCTPLGCYDTLLTKAGGETLVSHLAGTAFELTQKELKAAPTSLRQMLTLVRRIFSRDGDFLQVVKGSLEHRAVVGMENDLLKKAFPDVWPQFLLALKREGVLPAELEGECPADPTDTNEVPPTETPGASETAPAGNGQTADGAAASAGAEGAGNVDRSVVAAKAGIRADEILASGPGVTVVTPGYFTQGVLTTTFTEKGFAGATARILGWFDPKADNEHRVRAGYNKYRAQPTLDRGRLAEFVVGFDTVFTKDDVCVVLEGIAENAKK